MPEKPVMKRKDFLISSLLGTGLLLSAGSLVTRLFQYLFPLIRKPREVRVPVGPASGLTTGQSKVVSIEGMNAIVINDKGTLRAFSRVCTHLGCIVKWHSETNRFHCPCHNAEFSSDGTVLSGPAPKPLIAYGVEEVAGTVYVKFESRELFT